ncbi:MAG: A24 family peptidase [Candidatus Thorarchaeota archaeon]
MDLYLGIATATFVFLLLVIASIQDYQTKEVSNWVWLVGLLASPITIIRIAFTGLWFVYLIQIFVVFIIVIVAFQVGLLGGADGKVILIVSVLYPWIILDPFWIIVAPFSILIGGYILLGAHSLWLFIRNIVEWSQLSKTIGIVDKPKKKTYWLTRSLSKAHAQNEQWQVVEVPLIVYFCIVFTTLLILTTFL